MCDVWNDDADSVRFSFLLSHLRAMFLELPLFLCAGLAAEASSAAHGAHTVAQYYHARISQRSPFLISPVTKSRKRRTDNSTVCTMTLQPRFGLDFDPDFLFSLTNYVGSNCYFIRRQ